MLLKWVASSDGITAQQGTNPARLSSVRIQEEAVTCLNMLWLQEVRARGGELYVFADGDSNITSEERVHVIRLPENYGMLSPILHVVPLQLLAYHAALVCGTDVDKPRNLAKSVTVE